MMQTYNQTPPVVSPLLTKQWVPCHRMPSPIAQMEYYRRQQILVNQQSHGLQNGQTSSQPVSSSSDLQSRQMPQMIVTPAVSTRATLPNQQLSPLPAAQHGTPIQNLQNHLGHQASSRNTVPQPNYNMATLNKVNSTLLWYLSDHSSANSAVKQNLRHQSVLPQYQLVNGPHHREQIHQPAAQPQQTDWSGHFVSTQAPQNNHNNQGQIKGAQGNSVLYSTFNHYPATSQRLITPSQVSNNGHQTHQSHSSQIENQVQHSLQTQPSAYRTENNYASYSGYNHQSLTSNLPSPPSYTVNHFVIQNQNQRINQSAELGLPPGNSPLPCYAASYTIQQQKKSHIPTKTSSSEKPESAQICNAPPVRHGNEIQRVINYQAPVRRTAILKENEQVLGKQLTAPHVPSFKGMPSRSFQTDSITKKNNGYKSDNGHGEVQNFEDVAETLELVIALERVLQQSYKSVAVVPPISQQVPSAENKNTTSNDGLPFKINAVWTLVNKGKNMKEDSRAQNLPKEITEELLQFSGPHPETQESNKHDNESTVNRQESDTPSADVPQCKVGTTTSQGPVCSTVLTTETPEDHSKVKSDESNCNIVDLSKVEVLNFTMDNFNNWVKSLENQPERSIKGQEAHVVKRLLDLFWDGKIQNLEKQVHMFPSALSSVYSQVSTEEMQTAVFQYLQPEDLSKLAHGYHILKNNANLPTEEFRSSWLNIDEQPADIENILAEPISDLNLTDYALQTNFNTLDVYSVFEPSTEVGHAETDCQNNKMIKKDLAKPQVCESKSNDKISSTQEPSKKHEDGNLEKPQQQNGKLGPEESEASNDTADTLSQIRTESEQDATRESVTSKTSSESVEQRDLSNDANSSSDSELFELSLLSPDDTRTIFKEESGCDLQKEPSELCQDETQDSVTPNNKSKDFPNSSKLIKFTCPHVATTDWNGEHFCSMCWEETPLLDLDLEEALFSPRGSSPKMRSPPTQGHHDQSCSPQSGNPDSNCTALSESSSIAGSPTPKDAVSEVTLSVPDINSSDTAQSCAQNLESPIVPEQTKTPRDEVSLRSNRLSKKSKLSKGKKKTVNDPFTADLVKASSKKPHPSDLTVTPAEDEQNCREETKERGEERNSPVKQKIQSNPPQPDDPELNMNICSESSSDSSNPSTSGVNMSLADPDPDLGDSNRSPNSPDKESELSGKSPDKEVHRRVHSDSVKLTMPIIVEECEAQSPTKKIKKGQTIISSLTTAGRRKVSPPRYLPCKKAKFRTAPMSTEDLFTPDIMVKKTSTPNPHLINHSVTPSEDVQHPFKEERNKKGVESKFLLKVHHKQQSVQTKTDAREKKTAAKADKKIIKTTQTGHKGMKKLRLYGFSNSKMVQQQFYSKTKSSIAPVYITIFNTHETSHSYTDSPSAKQKVYSDWSSTFVETKKRVPPHM